MSVDCGVAGRRCWGKKNGWLTNQPAIEKVSIELCELLHIAQGGVAFFEAEGPKNPAEDVVLIDLGDFRGVFALVGAGFPSGIPNVFAVAEAGVEDFAFAEFLVPADGVIARGAVVWMGIQAEETMDGRGVVGFEDVDFVEDFVAAGEGLGGGMGFVVDDGLDFHLGFVGLEFAAEHVNIGTEFVEGVGTGVHRDESFAAFDQVNESLGVGEGEFAGGVAEDEAVVLLNVFSRQLAVGVGSDFVFPSFAEGKKFGHGGGVGFFFGLEGFVGIFGFAFGFVGVFWCGFGLLNEVDGEGSAFGGQFGEDFFAGLDGGVAEACGDGDNEQLFGGGFGEGGEGKDAREDEGGKTKDSHKKKVTLRDGCVDVFPGIVFWRESWRGWEWV